MFHDATYSEIDQAVKAAASAFHQYRSLPAADRSRFLHAIAVAIEKKGDALLQVAMKETNLPEARLRNERSRTIFQLRSYADAAAEGSLFEATIDTAEPYRQPPKPDIRKMLVPVGPVAVFGAANFPFAYSTAGGDTASALAAGCPVIVKAHPAHAHTSQLVADAIHEAVKETGMPEGVFAHIFGAGNEVGKYLVEHPLVRAVGFTGSLRGGKQLFDWANARPVPIPVFAEMSSINPVYLLPGKLRSDAASLAEMLAGSITLGVGQFCTNPGLIIGIGSDALRQFVHDLGKAIQHVVPGTMLHSGIADNYREKREEALMQDEVHLVAESNKMPAELQGQPTIATVSGAVFLQNPVLHREVFGPYSLVVECADGAEMKKIADAMEGQLTATVMGTPGDLDDHAPLLESIKDGCGRMILNGVPTGVEVCLAMQHGGPYPATTDARYTAVGADALKRFLRPLAYQGWSDDQLPPALQNRNPLNLLRRVNNEWTRDPVAE